MRKLIHELNSWFFEVGDARVAAALRIAYGLLFLYALWDLYPTLDLMIGHAGIYGTLDRSAFNPGWNPFTLLYYFDSPIQLQIWFWGSVLIAAMTICGLFTRVSVVLLFCTAMMFYTRTPPMLYGADKVYRMCLLWVVFLATDRRWSLDAYLRKKRHTAKSTRIPLWPVKSLQIQMALIYLMATFSKLHSPAWLNGSAVYYAFNYYPFVWEYAPQLSQFKPLVIMLTYYSLFAEMLFPFLVFIKKTKWIAILSVFGLHVGIILLLHLVWFSACMFVGYLAFITPSEWEWLATRFRKRASEVAPVSSATF